MSFKKNPFKLLKRYDDKSRGILDRNQDKENYGFVEFLAIEITLDEELLKMHLDIVSKNESK